MHQRTSKQGTRWLVRRTVHLSLQESWRYHFVVTAARKNKDAFCSSKHKFRWHMKLPVRLPGLNKWDIKSSWPGLLHIRSVWTGLLYFEEFWTGLLYFISLWTRLVHVKSFLARLLHTKSLRQALLPNCAWNKDIFIVSYKHHYPF